MKLLVLGGTQFLGRHLVAAALARGHEVTLFTRGKTNPQLFPEAERLHGDRDGDLSSLEGRRWDVAVDTSGYVPRVVRRSAELLAGAVEHYTFVSSVSVYADFGGPVEETSRVATLEDESTEDIQEHYGPLKAACERAVAETLPGRVLVVRPGLIVGPDDPTDRFTYWVRRIAGGGDVLAPGPPDRRVQLIDVRDLAEWMLRMAEERRTGFFNATGPHPRPTMAELLEACKRATGSDARLVWIDADFLLERGVEEWQELPLWIADPKFRGFLDADVSRARAAGLTFRPLEETARDTEAWDRESGGERPEKAGVQIGKTGLEPAREAELLDAWRARA